MSVIGRKKTLKPLWMTWSGSVETELDPFSSVEMLSYQLQKFNLKLEFLLPYLWLLDSAKHWIIPGQLLSFLFTGELQMGKGKHTLQDHVQYSTVQYRTMCSTVQFSTGPCAVQYSAVQDHVQFSTVQYRTMCSTVRCSTGPCLVQYSTVQDHMKYSTLQYRTLCSTGPCEVQYSIELQSEQSKVWNEWYF